MPIPGNCPECGSAVGPGSAIDAYKHAIACLHMEPGPPERLLPLYEANGSEHGKRVGQLLRLHLASPESPVAAPPAEGASW